MPRFRNLLLISSALLIVETGVIWRIGRYPAGALLSKAVQFVLGLMCLLMFVRAYVGATSSRRHCWLSLAVATGICVVAQGLEIEIGLVSLPSLEGLKNLLFFISGMPVAMLLFLAPDEEHDRPDWLHLLGLLQVCTFSFCVYLYFSGQALTAVTTLGSAPFGWNTSLVFDGVLAFSFTLRAALTRSSTVRRLFGPMALYLVAAGLADSYAEVAANHVEDGSYFDLIWTVLLVAPLLISAIWNQDPRPVPTSESQGQRIIVDQFFPLLYPFCSLLLITLIAERQRFLSSFLTSLIFVTVAVRILVIQHRLAKTQDALSFEATHDALTALPNRSEILRRLETEMDRQKRTGESFAVLLVDADHFKRVNDTYGHNVGDEVLREIARRFSASLRPYDSVGRYGGEEFLIVIPGCSGPEAFVIAERLRQNVAAPLTSTSAGSIPVTISSGLITCNGVTELDRVTLLRMVDEALYRAKAKGRDRVESAVVWGSKLKQIRSEGVQPRVFQAAEPSVS